MIAISNDFKTAMKQPVKELDAYIELDEDNKITSADDLISFKISCDTGMCKTAMRKLEGKYLGEHNLLGQWVHVGFGVKLPNGTFEYLDYGSFLITEITTTKDTGVTQIIGYDKMINSMTKYSKLNIEYPITLYEYTQILCSRCGLILGNETFTHADWLINQELWENINGITYRDILVQIAQVTASTCIISNDDKVYFKSIYNTEETLTYDNMKKLKLNPIYGEINSVVLSRTPQEDNIYMRDEESVQANGLTEYKIENNEIIDKDRDNAMTPIYNALHGISYYPFETTTEGLGWYEIADNFDIINDTGDTFNTTLFNFSITIDGGIKEILKTVAETKTQTQYQYATTIAKRVKNTEIIVNKQEQYIEELVTDMYEEDGVVHENFTKVYQDIDNIINSVQNSGGSNLIKNSVMFAYDNDNIPSNWDIEGAGKNLFDKDNANILNAYLSSDKIVSSSSARVIYIPCSPNTTYIIQKVKGNAFSIAYTETTPIIGATIIDRRNTASSPTLTITTGENAKYLVSQIMDGGDVLTEEEILNSIQIEKGLSASPYESYTDGELIIESNTESFNAGCLSGHIFTLNNKIARQKIEVKIDNDDTIEKVYYTFSTKIKKGLDGNCYVKIYNSIEEYIIELKEGQESFYGDYEIKGLLPKDSYYIIEFYGSADSNATFTDNMFAIGEYKSKWQQANGEIMNTQVNINVNGVLVKSSIYQGDYTIMSPLEFAGYSKINGTITKVFSLNKDVTLVKKLEAEDEIKMVPIKVVPITSGDLQGWAFVPSTGGGN